MDVGQPDLHLVGPDAEKQRPGERVDWVGDPVGRPVGSGLAGDLPLVHPLDVAFSTPLRSWSPPASVTFPQSTVTTSFGEPLRDVVNGSVKLTRGPVESLITMPLREVVPEADATTVRSWRPSVGSSANVRETEFDSGENVRRGSPSTHTDTESTVDSADTSTVTCGFSVAVIDPPPETVVSPTRTVTSDRLRPPASRSRARKAPQPPVLPPSIDDVINEIQPDHRDSKCSGRDRPTAAGRRPSPATRGNRGTGQRGSSDRAEFATTSRLLVVIARAASSGLSRPANASGTAAAL